MKKLILLSVLGLAAIHADAQAYITAVGARIGPDWGLTLQQRLTRRITIEGIAESSPSRNEYMLTGLVQRHLPIFVRHFNLYAGGGIHRGWSRDTREFVQDPAGLTLVGGVELTLGRINLSFDYKPSLNIVGGERRFFTTNALSVRYVLIKDRGSKDRRDRRSRDDWRR